MKNGKIIIGYISLSDPFKDKNAWSGTIYKIREAIENAGFEVKWISYRDKGLLFSFFKKLRRIYNSITNKIYLSGCHFAPEAYLSAKSIDNRILKECDYLFFPGGAQLSLFIKINIPIIYYTDATVFGMINYYWFNLSKYSIIMSKKLEIKACRKAFLNIRASKWAIDSVIKDCNCNPAKCHILEFGPNIDTKNIIPITPYKKGELRILFSGVDWERKGGDIAIDTVKILRQKGLDAHLYIVGIKEIPEYCKRLSYVSNAGFLDKSLPLEYNRYISLFTHCHIFLLPTKAECAGIVFCEAAAFGMPVYTYDTGGTANYVINKINGYTLKLSATGKDFANQINGDILNHKMQFLCNGALNLSKSKLSWESWSERFSKLIN